MTSPIPPPDPSRRQFLARTGGAILGSGLLGCAAHRNAGPAPALRVLLQPQDDPAVRRAAAIFTDRVQLRTGQSVELTGSRPDLIFAVNRQLPPDAFGIESAGGRAIRVSGGTPRGLLYGVGKLLRTSSFGAGFHPTTWRGESRPDGTLRGMYFASHFHNWYHQASEAEISRYLEDLALWGTNAVMVILPMINLRGWDDPQTEPALAMVRQYARAARGLGLQFATGLNNTMFIGAPQSIRATRLPDPTGRRGNSGHPICPSRPEGHAYLVENARIFFAKLADVGLDILVHWPYDEGGCACDQCRPWGSHAYLQLSREFTELGRSFFPQLKSVLSTWMFDTPPEGEWAGLSTALAADPRGVDFILADAHEDYPRYPLDVEIPGRLPLLNFPEISMWGNWPWGGVGANPLPERFQRLWDQVKAKVQGGFPYSEGIYEDLNKAVVSQFYWNRQQSARDTLAEYIRYEFGPGAVDDTLALIALLEDTASKSYRKQPVDRDAVTRGRSLAESVAARLPEWGRRGWRWEIVELRARLDYERYVGGGLQTPAAEAALLRLMEIYHSQLETDDPYHHRVRPPLKRAVSRKGNL